MKLLAIAFALCAALPAQAGGPVILEEPVEEGAPARFFSPGEKIALAAGIILFGVLISSRGSDSPAACSCFTPDEGGTCTC